MPYRKRQNTANRRRAVYKRKKSFKQSIAGRRLARLGSSSLLRPSHKIMSGSELGVVDLTANVAGQIATGFIGAAFAYQLNQLINHTDFTNLYDQYKIIAVKHNFKWSISKPSIADNLINNPPIMLYFTDNDDNTTPTHDTFTERASTKQFALKANKVYTINLKPACLQEVYRTSVSTAYVPKWGQFIDMGNDNVPHFGLKVGFNYTGSTSGVSYGSVSHWYTIMIACKGVR